MNHTEDLLKGLTGEGDAIKLRVKRDIRKLPMDKAELMDYFKRIEQTKGVQKALSWQHEDGYFTYRMHSAASGSGEWSCEGCLRYLYELGFDLSYEPLRRGFEALKREGWEKELQGNAAEAFDYPIIRAALLALYGEEDHPAVQKTISQALDSFRILLDAERIEDICLPYKQTHVFAPGKYLPNIYLLRTLAFTHKWRTAENLAMLISAYQKLYDWLPLPPTYIKRKSQLIAAPQNIDDKYNSLPAPAMIPRWLEFYELSARLSLLPKTSPFRKHITSFADSLLTTPYETQIKPAALRTWSGYTGFSTEPTQTPRSRRNALIFRTALITSLLQN